MPSGTPRPHLILLGGFLGAGKTTAMRALVGWLADQGIRAGCVTNDQAGDLVDTALMRWCGVATEEVAGGCFCCRFDELIGATRRMRGVLPPDVIIAEAVGSCTDLVATVADPARRLHRDDFTVAPLSVLVDPRRALAALGAASGERFSPDVEYIFRKQLEEADVVVVNKGDVIDEADRAALLACLAEAAPAADIVVASVRTGAGVDAWFRRIAFGERAPRRSIDVDYDRYADGESRLGWFNAAADLASRDPQDGNALLSAVAESIRRELRHRGAAIAHLKMTLRATEPADAGFGAINLVGNDVVAEPGSRLGGALRAGELTINLRAEAEPEALEEAARRGMSAAPAWSITMINVAAFRPGRPVPTHRDRTVTLPST